MKLMVGTRILPDVIQQLARWFPARAADLACVEEQSVLGLQMDLAPLKRRHSDSQRGAYWSGLHEFAAHLGYSKREAETLLHEVMLCETYGTKEAREIVASGQTYRWPVPAERSSKDADGRVRDVQTYSELIETLLRVAAEHGYIINIGA